MKPPPSSVQNLVLSGPQVAGLLIGAFTVGFPAFLLWNSGNALFGQNPLPIVFAISAVGGAMSFALFAGRKLWLVAGVLGCLAGIGASGSILAYAAIFQRQAMYSFEVALVIAAGATPSILVLVSLMRKSRLRIDPMSAMRPQDRSCIDREALGEIIKRELLACTDEQRAFIRAAEFPPEQWRIVPLSSGSRGFWAIAIDDDRVLWYNEFERGFNVSRFKVRGEISAQEYLCNEAPLAHAIPLLAGHPGSYISAV